jgi:organic radical activating enzyme
MNSIKILDIFIGNKCNLSCFQCDTRSDIVKSKSLDPSIESIKQGILLAQQYFTIEHYSLLGGEPLFYMDKVEEIVAFIRSFDSTTPILLPTNGKMIDKKADELARLISQYNLTLMVCNHFSAFEDKTLSNELTASIGKFVKKTGLIESKQHTFFDQLIDEGLFVNQQGTVTLFFRDQDYFQSNYYLDNNKPKPFASGDPDASYANGCCSPYCTFLRDSKLYKCAALATVKTLLIHHDNMDDPAWQKYLNYKPLDLTNCTLEEVAHFSNTKYRSIGECDMCPSQSKSFTKTKATVISIKEIV